MRLRQDVLARWQQVPGGMRDLPPAEAARRSGLEAALREEFRRWGYREVVTPTLEFLETFQRGADPGVADRLIKVVDAGGALLALRPEMTVPIARLAATRLLPSAVRPLRVAYVAPVFRGQEAGPSRRREFTQAGVELLGDASVDADAEVIALAVTCLARAGVERPVLHVGELGFLNDVLGVLPDDEQDEVRTRLAGKAFAGIESAVSDAGLAKFLRALPDLVGGTAVAQAAEFARSERGAASLARLSAVLERLADYGVADRVVVDLSVIRDFSYYTGIVFEAYDPGMGFPLLGGGRYDTLLARFGVDCPATGFAAGIERILGAVGAPGDDPVAILVAADASGRAEAIRLAQDLRALGNAVVVSTDASPQQVARQAAALNARSVIWIEGRTLRVADGQAQRARVVDREELLADLSGQPKVISWTH